MGHAGNEAADNRAKYHANHSQPTIHTYQSYGKQKQDIDQIIRALWTDRWKSSADCRQTKIWLPELNKQLSKQLTELPRKTLSTVIHLLTGHNWLNYHNFNIHQEESKLCRLCGLENETSTHVLAECEVLWQERAKHFVYPTLNTTRPSWTLASIIGFIDEKALQIFHL